MPSAFANLTASCLGTARRAMAGLLCILTAASAAPPAVYGLAAEPSASPPPVACPANAFDATDDDSGERPADQSPRFVLPAPWVPQQNGVHGLPRPDDARRVIRCGSAPDQPPETPSAIAPVLIGFVPDARWSMPHAASLLTAPCETAACACGRMSASARPDWSTAPPAG